MAPAPRTTIRFMTLPLAVALTACGGPMDAAAALPATAFLAYSSGP